jgi:RHS repeat-associated protein
VAYNPFGDITSLPEADAGGPELTNSYYADNQLQSMTQHENKTEPEETIGYKLDPAGRTREAVATGKLENTDTINHFAGPASTPAWTTNPAGSEWSRDIPGIDGQLAAIQYNGETPVLQLANLHGDIIATASLSETATKPASTISEATPYGAYGIPATEAPPKYAWLGAIELPTELPSGVISMGARSYIPALGRFLQPDPKPGGSANAYAYTFGNPLNTSDPSGEAAEYINTGPSAALIDWSAQSSAQAAAQQAAENAAARAAAERLAAEQAAAEAAAYGPLGGEEYWEEWWEEEEGEWEWVSYHPRTKSGKQEAHVEPAILVQPLISEETRREDEASHGGVAPPCNVSSAQSHHAPCVREASFFGHLFHTVLHWLSHAPPTSEIWGTRPPEPPFVDHAVRDLDDWGFDDIEFDW